MIRHGLKKKLASLNKESYRKIHEIDYFNPLKTGVYSTWKREQ